MAVAPRSVALTTKNLSTSHKTVAGTFTTLTVVLNLSSKPYGIRNIRYKRQLSTCKLLYSANVHTKYFYTTVFLQISQPALVI